MTDEKENKSESQTKDQGQAGLSKKEIRANGQKEKRFERRVAGIHGRKKSQRSRTVAIEHDQNNEKKFLQWEKEAAKAIEDIKHHQRTHDV